MSTPFTIRRDGRLPAAILAVFFAAAPALAAEPSLARTAADAALKWGGCPDFMPKGCEIAVLHGDPAKDDADVFFRVPANAVIPRHWHTSAERMVLVAGEMRVTYDGHETVVLKPGTYAYGPPRAPHKATCGGSGPCVLFIAFESPVDVFAGGPDEK
ncbi:MAG: cupin domain-containing protein [Thiobacillus sp.]|jgi:quercetin dioxygenase-like cupin family protein|uniref:cupin domain-containing protein n=1 Tax=Thiobacillus sp. TaxID=924 RepID=UPI002893CFCB|nr:cupin domain-containing protein [Thiobacillus sp.]MDT3705944.1 cupin domain-containing protein [Thiobacillus sp.]